MNTLSTRTRVGLRAGAVALAALCAAAIGGVAHADTAAAPDTNTKAAFAPTAGSAGAVAGSALAGAGEGSSVNVHVDGGAGTFFGATARLCKPGMSIVTLSQLNPTGGNCIPAPFVPGSDDNFLSAPADSTHTSADFVFRVGSGSQTFQKSNGQSATITCDANNPCALWLAESVSNASDGSGTIFKHFDIAYAGTPDAPAISVVPGNGALTVNLTAPANTGNAPLGTYSVTVTGPGGATQSGAGTSYVFSGLTNGTTYSVTATVSNVTQGGGTPSSHTSAAGTGSGTPVAPPPDPCAVPKGLVSGPVNSLSPALHGVAHTLCGLGL